MKTGKHVWLRILIPLLIVVTPARAVDLVNAAGPIRMWYVARSPDPRESADLDNDSLQLIAQQMGDGQFYVLAGKIPETDLSIGPARVFYIFSSADAALKNVAPVRRVFYGGAREKMWIRSGGDAELVSGFFQSRSKDEWNDKIAAKLIPDVLLATLYAGRARLLSVAGQALFDAQLDKRRQGGPGQRSELRALGQEPVLLRDAAANWTWKGRFILADGGVEDVTAIVPQEREGLVRLERKAVRPRGYFPEIVTEELPLEKWTVAKEVSWRPPQRCEFMLTLAALGNTPMKYKLAVALLQEGDDGSMAEGIKWLNAAAADGSKDAMIWLATISSGPIRPARDREIVRMQWCGCSIKKAEVK